MDELENASLSGTEVIVNSQQAGAIVRLMKAIGELRPFQAGDKSWHELMDAQKAVKDA